MSLRTLKQTAPDTLVAEGDPKNPAGSVAGSPCPLNARVTYRFLEDRVELVLKQSMDQYGQFAWIPSASVLASRDALTDCPTAPDGPAPYGQTDPRWTTKDGPVLRFDFGVWQRGFVNANWGDLDLNGERVRYLHNTAPAARPLQVAAYPMAHPGPGDALTFDINAGPEPSRATVRFEVRDYLTQEPVASKSTELNWPPGAGTPLLPI